MSEVAFHKQRRMFYLTPGNNIPMFAPVNDPRSHKAWMHETQVGALYSQVIRGYADKTGIYLYRGDDYWLNGEDFESARQGAKRVALHLRLSPKLQVWGGVIPGPIGTRWKGRFKLGTVRSVCKVSQCQKTTSR